VTVGTTTPNGRIALCAIGTPADTLMMSVVASLPFLRRFVVVDANFDVMLAGDAPDRLAPFTEPIEREVLDEIRRLVGEQDFERAPVATGLVDVRYALRVTRQIGAGSVAYGVAIERTRLAGPLRVAATRFALTPVESETLRLVIGGYERGAMASRLGVPLTISREIIQTLRTKLACQTRTDFITLIERCRVDKAPTFRHSAQRLHA